MVNQNQSNGDGKLENLEAQIQDLINNSVDHYFTEHLQKLRDQVRAQKNQQNRQADQLKGELERSLNLYWQRNPQVHGAGRAPSQGIQKVTGNYSGSVMEQTNAAQSYVEQQNTEQSNISQPSMERLKSEQPDVMQSNMEQPGVEKLIVEQPGAEQLNVEQPGAAQPNVEKLNTEQSSMEQSNTELPGVEQPNVKQPNVEQSNAELPGVEQPNVKQPDAEQSNTELPGVEQSNAELPGVEQSSVKQPDAEQSNTKQQNVAHLYRNPSNMNPPNMNPPNMDRQYNQAHAFYQAPVTNPPVKKKSAEFALGVAGFSVIGAVFILIAFVMFGMNFMNGLVRGICLYLIAVALLSTGLLLYKKNPKIGMILTAIGICGLYLSTVLNYQFLHNLGAVAAVLITTVTSLGTLFLSRKKDSGLLRVIVVIASYLCFLLIIQQGIEDTDFLVLTIILFLLSAVSVVLPVKKSVRAIGITHMISGAFFSLFIVMRAALFDVGSVYLAVFAVLSLILLNYIYYTLLKCNLGDSQDENNPNGHPGNGYSHAGIVQNNVSINTIFIISAFFYVIMLGYVLNYNQEADYLLHICMAVTAAVCIIFFLLEKRMKEKWMQYYFYNILVFFFYVMSDGDLQTVIAMLGMLLISKLLSRVRMLRVSEVIITALACLFTLFYIDTNYIYAMAAGLVISLVLTYNWQTYYECIITAVFVILATNYLPNLIKLPVIVGGLFAGTVLFNNVKRYKGKAIQAYNYLALAVQVLCYFMLSGIIYRGAYVTYFMMLIFGLAVIIHTFQASYSMAFRFKNLILAIFLTYMALISRMGIPVLTSIILMVIALISVGIGFAFRQKGVRIYGLVLSLFICGKVILFDFYGAEVFQKMVVFFVVGFIALIIAGIYIVLEKRDIKAE